MTARPARLRFVRTQMAVVVTLGLLGVVHTLLAQEASGTWQASIELDVGSGQATFVFEQDGEAVSGRYQGTFGAAEVTGRVEDDQIEFWFETQGSRVTYNGSFSDTTMKGTCEYSGVGVGTWEAEKIE